MKKLFVLIVLIVAISCFSFVGCEINRKLNGAEINFAKTVKNSKEFSFDMSILTEDNQKINLTCFKSDNDYAYKYSFDGVTYPTYRRIFIKNKQYDILEVYDKLNTSIGSIPVGTGMYYSVDNVSYMTEDNLLYHVSENLLTATYLTLVKSCVKEKDSNGMTLYRYDFTYEGDNYSFWFDNTYLRRVRILFSDNTSYDISFSNFHFGTVDREFFVTPEETAGLYVKSPFTFQEWANILGDFSSKINGCLPK